MGHNSARLLRYAISYPSGWIPFGKEKSTVEALRRLSASGFIIRDMEKRRFRLALPADYQEAIDAYGEKKFSDKGSYYA